MSYNNRKFLTYINYDGTNAKDSYQHEDIKEALNSTIDEQVSGLRNLSLSARHSIKSNSYYHDFRDCLCGIYFDGTNLDEVLDECNASYVAYYVDKQIPNPEGIQLFSEDVVGSFVSYRSESAMEQFPDVQPTNHFSDVEYAAYVECMQKTNMYRPEKTLHYHFVLHIKICRSKQRNN